MSGLFITIDALDGIGKTTLVESLAKALGGAPMSTPGTAMREVAEAALTEYGGDQTARGLFYTSTVISQGRKARARADNGEIIVMDRYWPSTLSYAMARGVSDNLAVLGDLIPKADLSICLTLEEGERERRLRGRGKLTPADSETLSPAFRRVVVKQMQALTDTAVDMTGADRSEAVARVMAVVRQFRLSRPA